MKILVFSDHLYNSDLQATLHWVVDALVHYQSADVTFVSTPLNLIGWLRGDARFAKLRMGTTEHNGVRLDASFRLFGGQNLHNAMLNRLYYDLALAPSLRAWCKSVIRRNDKPDVILIETGFHMAAYKEIKRALPDVPIVYWVSDDPRTLKMGQRYYEVDREIASGAALVIVNSPQLLERYPGAVAVYNGPDFDRIDVRELSTPFSTEPKVRVVSLGRMLFDRKCVEEAAAIAKDIEFHILGPSGKSELPNLFYYNEVPFAETLRFLANASIGLAPYKAAPNVSYIAQSSLKIKQYSHANLPIVCPSFAASDRVGFFPYEAGDAFSLAKAVVAAASSPGAQSMIPERAWAQTAAMITGVAVRQTK